MGREYSYFTNLRKLEESEARYRNLFEEMPLSLWEKDFSLARAHLEEIFPGGDSRELIAFLKKRDDLVLECISRVKILDVNSTTVSLLDGKNKKQFIGSIDRLALPTSLDIYRRELLAIHSGQYEWEQDLPLRTFSNREIRVLLNWYVPPDSRSNFSRVILTLSDITELQNMQTQLQHSQKMKSIGQLAGGIAHDFNNILGGMMGFAELIQPLTRDNEEIQNYLSQIISAGERARELIQKIMTFSRTKKKEKSFHALEPIIGEAADLLKATLPASVSLKVIINPLQDKVLISGTEFHEMILNLVTNSVQAMEGNGAVTVSLFRSEKTAGFRGIAGFSPPGAYALLEVSDTGPGINSDEREKIFDPFYTTKDEYGTGLGLAMIYGMIKSSSGNIQVDNGPEGGARFRIYLPLGDDPSDLTQKEGIRSV